MKPHNLRKNRVIPNPGWALVEMKSLTNMQIPIPGWTMVSGSWFVQIWKIQLFCQISGKYQREEKNNLIFSYLAVFILSPGLTSKCVKNDIISLSRNSSFVERNNMEKKGNIKKNQPLLTNWKIIAYKVWVLKTSLCGSFTAESWKHKCYFGKKKMNFLVLILLKMSLGFQSR